MGWPGSRGHRVRCVIDWEAESTVRLWVAKKDDEKVSFPTARSPPADMSPAELPESRCGSRLSAPGLRATRRSRSWRASLWLLAGGSRAGTVDVIISGDADLLSLREYNGTPILSASDYIARMLQET
jgi:hypothetical protein